MSRYSPLSAQALRVHPRRKLTRSCHATTRLLVICLLLSFTTSAMALEWEDLWFTPDQQGQQLMDRGKYRQAAEKFTQPENIGVALFMAGDFKAAASVFGRSNTLEAKYNLGNAYTMLGDYDGAIDAYEQALRQRPDWLEAQQNLEIVKLRKLAKALPDDDFGGTGGQLGADEIVFDLNDGANKASGEEIVDAENQQFSEDEMRAMWLRKVEPRPADFLAARFGYQLAVRESEQAEAGAVNDPGNKNE